MISYLKGNITHKSPTYVIVENQGIGYQILVSLNTRQSIGDDKDCRLFTRMVVKNENQNVTGFMLYGFYEEKERELFEKLISVSGVGANTAIVMLSTYRVSEIVNAIVSGDVGLIKSIKGIGPKSAQRIILELKDKVEKTEEGQLSLGQSHNTLKEDALVALMSLGFAKNMALKAINKAMAANAEIDTVEDLIKQSLKLL
ncbi:MAG: Holliday junction branch migration protein RuvA [Chitinophagales bacterium]